MADLAGKNIAILVDNYFEQVEMTGPRGALSDAGSHVQLVSCSEKTVHGMEHAEIRDAYEADEMLENVEADDFEALVLPGGVINGDQLRINEKAQRLVKDFESSNKPLAIICHAPWILVDSGLARGKQLTSYHTIKQDLINAGAEWKDEKCVVDGNLITSRNPSDIPAFNEAIISALQK